MDKARALRKIADDITACPLCRKGGTGKAVPGEGSPCARVFFVGEAPGREEAKTGRPFVGRSGKFLRQAISDIGLTADDIFISSPGHYLPLRGAPAKETIVHGREHLFEQLEIVDPSVVVLLGSTACLALLDKKVEIIRDHGSILTCRGRTCLVTFHPAYAMRFPDGRRLFLEDFRKLKRFLSRSAP